MKATSFIFFLTTNHLLASSLCSPCFLARFTIVSSWLHLFVLIFVVSSSFQIKFFLQSASILVGALPNFFSSVYPLPLSVCSYKGHTSVQQSSVIPYDYILSVLLYPALFIPQIIGSSSWHIHCYYTCFPIFKVINDLFLDVQLLALSPRTMVAGSIPGQVKFAHPPVLYIRKHFSLNQ